ncbi:EpsG family protein [Citrobacter europaeus]|uniref:EpsG family protein n=1 Tax=Citrobacter europaeus TaxID=1914243 RepID=UPI000538410D|nr:EpsG family protein [Citrobacter europaeus]AUT96507.1 EpsG family protein [Citrobacter freundii]ROW33794.1 EpsG family protein [Citrobacter europaeus]
MNKNFSYFDVYVFTLFFIFAWALYGGNTWNGDRDAYELYYARDGISPWGVEILYGYINILFYNAGVSFQKFQIFISLLTLAITSFYLKKTSAFLGVSFFLYFILMFPLDYVLMRTSLSYAIVLNAFVALSLGKRFYYILLICISTLIHQSALLFMVFLLANDSSKLKSAYNYVIYSILLIVISLALSNFNFFAAKIVEHFSYYQTTWKTILSSIVYHSFSIYLIVKNFNRKGPVSRYDCFIRNLNIVSLLLFCFYFQADIFVRIFRLLVFVNIIYLVQGMFINKKATIYSLIYVLLYSVYLVYYYIYPTLEYSLYPLIKENVFFN